MPYFWARGSGTCQLCCQASPSLCHLLCDCPGMMAVHERFGVPHSPAFLHVFVGPIWFANGLPDHHPGGQASFPPGGAPPCGSCLALSSDGWGLLGCLLGWVFLPWGGWHWGDYRPDCSLAFGSSGHSCLCYGCHLHGSPGPCICLPTLR